MKKTVYARKWYLDTVFLGKSRTAPSQFWLGLYETDPGIDPNIEDVVSPIGLVEVTGGWETDHEPGNDLYRVRNSQQLTLNNPLFRGISLGYAVLWDDTDNGWCYAALETAIDIPANGSKVVDIGGLTIEET